MNILSCFDGISCGQVALKRLNVKVDNYFASEIDKFAIKVTQHNFPNTIQLGNIRLINVDDLPKIDLLLGGFPCQAFSTIGLQKGFEDNRASLLYNLLDIKEKLLEKNPNLHFLFENVIMKKSYLEEVNALIGCEPIRIDSRLVSAQSRPRLYWTNIPNVEIPKDRGIKLQDILESGFAPREKSYVVKASEYPSVRPNYIKRYFSRHTGLLKYMDEEKTIFAPLSPIEAERLQTLDDNYTEVLSKSRRFNVVGNGWTVEVIKEILKDLYENN